MNIHHFQHSPTEGLGRIEPWAVRKGHTLTSTHFYRGEHVPNLEDVDWLMIMGGAMNIYEHRNHPWLVEEKQFIAQAIAAGKTVLGICLGAQLIADTMGGKVFQNGEVEIGWLPVRFTRDEVESMPIPSSFPPELTPFHWHGDTFSIPQGAVNFAESEGCRHQAFAVGSRIVGLQFHLEVGKEEIAIFLDGEADELGMGRFIQTKEEIIEATSVHAPVTVAALESLLDTMEATTVCRR